MRTCQPQVMEIFADPDYDPAQLTSCAQAHAETIGSTCEGVANQLIQEDGIHEDILTCGQMMKKTCPNELMKLAGAEFLGAVAPQVVISTVRELAECLKTHQEAISDTCEVFLDALVDEDEADDPDAPDWSQWQKGHTKGGYGKGGYNGYGGYGHSHDDDHEKKHHTGMTVFVTLLGLCMCGAFVGVAWFKRDEITGMMQGRRTHPGVPGNFMHLHDEEGLTSAPVIASSAPLHDPPGYAQAPIVTGAPVEMSVKVQE